MEIISIPVFVFLTFSDDWCPSIMEFFAQIRLIFSSSCLLLFNSFRSLQMVLFATLLWAELFRISFLFIKSFKADLTTKTNSWLIKKLWKARRWEKFENWLTCLIFFSKFDISAWLQHVEVLSDLIVKLHFYHSPDSRTNSHAVIERQEIRKSWINNKWRECCWRNAVVRLWKIETLRRFYLTSFTHWFKSRTTYSE